MEYTQVFSTRKGPKSQFPFIRNPDDLLHLFDGLRYERARTSTQVSFSGFKLKWIAIVCSMGVSHYNAVVPHHAPQDFQNLFESVFCVALREHSRGSMDWFRRMRSPRLKDILSQFSIDGCSKFKRHLNT